MDHRPKCKTQNVKLLEDNIRESRDDLVYSVTTPKAGSMERNHRLADLVKIKNVCPLNDSIRRVGQDTDWEEITAEERSDKGLSPSPLGR